MKEKIIGILINVIDFMSEDQIAEFIEQPPKKELGDYAFPCFRLAKELHKAPQMIAADIADQIKSGDSDISFLDKVDIQGAYVNFFLKKTEYVGGSSSVDLTMAKSTPYLFAIFRKSRRPNPSISTTWAPWSLWMRSFTLISPCSG